MAKAPLRLRLLAAVLAPLLVLGTAEIVLRVVGFRYDPYGLATGEIPYGELAESNLYSADPELIWTLKPSSVLEMEGLGFRSVESNEFGLRGQAPAEGSLRILCLGDSITFGLGLLEEETFPSRLEQALSARGEVVVVNGGGPGWSAVQGFGLLERLHTWNPDIVVFWFGMNDSKVARGLPDSRQMARSATMAGITRNLRALRVFQLFQQLLVPAPVPDPDARRVSTEEFAATVRAVADEWGGRAIFIRTPERLDETISEFRMMIADAERTRTTLIAGPVALVLASSPAHDWTDLTGQVMLEDGVRVLVYHPDYAELKVTLESLRVSLQKLVRLKSELDARLASLPTSALDAEDLFGDEPPGTVFHDNCHLNPHGADLAARAVAERIAEVLRER